MKFNWSDTLPVPICTRYYNWKRKKKKEIFSQICKWDARANACTLQKEMACVRFYVYVTSIGSVGGGDLIDCVTCMENCVFETQFQFLPLSLSLSLIHLSLHSSSLSLSSIIVNEFDCAYRIWYFLSHVHLLVLGPTKKLMTTKNSESNLILKKQGGGGALEWNK